MKVGLFLLTVTLLFVTTLVFERCFAGRGGWLMSLKLRCFEWRSLLIDEQASLDAQVQAPYCSLLSLI